MADPEPKLVSWWCSRGTPESDGLVAYEFRRQKACGRHQVRLAWTTRTRGEVERVRAVSRHTVHVLPEDPVGQWLSLQPSFGLLEAVCRRIQGATSGHDALEKFLQGVWTEPGCIHYDPSGDEIAAPDTAEIDGYLADTGPGPIPVNDAGGLIEDLAVWLLDGDAGRPRVKVVCHPLAHLTTLVAQLLGLHAETWVFGIRGALGVRPGCELLGSRAPTPALETFGQHSLTVLPVRRSLRRRFGAEARVAEICIARVGEGPKVLELGAYANDLVDTTSAGYERRSPQVSRPLVFARRDQEDHAAFLARLEGFSAGLERQVARSRPKDAPDAEVHRVYVGRGEPGWARAEWIGEQTRDSAAFQRGVPLADPDEEGLESLTTPPGPDSWKKVGTRRVSEVRR